MALNLSLFGKKCLVVSSDDQMGRLIATSMNQIGISDVVRIASIDEALKDLSQATYNFIICAGPEIQIPFDMVLRIRSEAPWNAAVAPIICITGHMDAADLPKILGSGANSVMTLPFTTRTMLKNVNRALNDRREMVLQPGYRGPCRRGKTPSGYEGPRRRVADTQSGAQPAVISEAPPETVENIRPATVRPDPAVASEAEALGTQNATILNGVHGIAATIEHLRRTLEATDDEPTRKMVRAEIMDAAQRLVNLMSLVDAKDDQSRNIGSALKEKIDSVKGTFTAILHDMSIVRADSINRDIDRFISGGEIALGCSDMLSARLAAVEEIVAVIGCRQSDGGIRRKLASAWDGIDKIQGIEAERFQLLDLGGKRKVIARRFHRPDPSGSVDDTVASQNHVSELIRAGDRRSEPM